MNIPQKNALEWAVFGLSLALVLGLMAFLIYEIAGQAGGGPALSVELGEPTLRAGQVEVPVMVVNSGEQAAEDVLVEVTVRRTGAEAVRAELTVPLLARGAAEEARVQVPAEGPVEGAEGRVVGYRLP